LIPPVQAGTCDGRSEVVIATMEMARLDPDLYQTLTERFATFLRVELRGLVKRAAEVGHPVLSS